MIKIAVDVMGGDLGPSEIVKGALEALKGNNCSVVLVGDEKQILAELKKCKEWKKLPVEIQHASEVIEMCEAPGNAIRKKRDASIVVATKLVKDGICDVVVSAGSTGAAVAAALFGLGRIKGVERPTIATPIPNLSGTTVLLDSGANVDSKPCHLVQSAIMGAIYAEKVFALSKPRVGLLNIGEEETKGNELALATYPLLSGVGYLNYIGNVEGRDITKGSVDVVVCDGFVGNVVLKFGEGLARVIMKLLKDAVREAGFLTKIASLLVLPAFKSLRKKLDYSEYGGAPLLGVKGGFIICHGSSKAKAIKNAVRVAKIFAEEKIVDRITEVIIEEGMTID